MKAITQITRNGPLQVTEMAAPEVGEHDVRVRIEAAGVLSYHRDVLEGRLGYSMPECPFVPGNDGVGVVEEIGAGVLHIEPGMRVAIDPRIAARDRVTEPEEMLLALIGLTAGATRLQARWKHGTWAEQVVLPVEAVTALPGLEAIDGSRLAALHKFAVCYGGLVRGELRAGQSVAVLGATGNFGSAAVPLALAMGASKVLALGRNPAVLDEIAALGPRVEAVSLTGDAMADGAAMRSACPDGVDVGLDLVGHATDAAGIQALLAGVRQHGRLVLQGSMDVPLQLPYGDVMRRSIEIRGAFMYPRDTFSRLAALVGSGQLDLDAVTLETYPFEAVETALDRAAATRGLGHVVLVPES